VTVGTRQPLTNNPVSTYNLANSVTIKTADLGNFSSLVAAFAGQDAVVEAFNPIAANFQVNVVEAALQSSVKHIITPDFGSDTVHENAKELRIFEPKVKAQKVLEESLKGSGIRWTAIIPGPFFDWGESP
jgi:putative NADH-flavin reductase